MKSTFRPAAPLALCAAVLLLCPGWTRAADDDQAQAARRTQSEALLHAMHTEDVLNHATERVYQMVDKYSQNTGAQTDLSPEQKTASQQALEEARLVIHQQLSWDAVKGDFIQAYADAFTEEELKGLVAFYNSPLGQKLVEKQPAVTEKMGKLTQQKMMAVMPTIMQKIKEASQKAPAASPSPAASATPTATVVPAPSATPVSSPK